MNEPLQPNTPPRAEATFHPDGTAEVVIGSVTQRVIAASIDLSLIHI